MIRPNSTMTSLVDCVWEHGATMPAQTALIMGETRLSYAELVQGASAAAEEIRLKGVSRGDRVILSAIHDIRYVFAYLGTQMVGAVTIPLDPDLPAPRFAEITDLVSPRQIYWLDSRHGTDTFAAFRDAGSVFSEKPDIDIDSPSEILFTSGTTGAPKGVVLTHRNQLASARNINSVIGNTSDDVEVIALPLYHSFGGGRLRCVLLAGGCAVLVDGYARPKRFFKALTEWNATGTSLVPAAWSLLSKLTGDYFGRFSKQLRYIEIGSAPMSIENKTALGRLLPDTKIMMHYGLTEASRSAFLEISGNDRPLASLGAPTPGVEIRILDNKGETVSPGVAGEICVAGDNVFAGYFGESERVSGTFWGQYFRTGDLGYFDTTGALWLAGRKSEMINVGGRKVAPEEVERTLLKIPGVADCVCVAAPDELSGETVAAILVAETDPIDGAEIGDVLKGNLETYKHPTILRWVDTIPRNQSGKTSRNKLKALLDV